MDHDILRAKQMADAKRRRASVEVPNAMAMEAADGLMNAIKKAVDGKLYCPTCEYPLFEDQPSCYNCEEKRKDDAKRLALWVEAIGGLRAWEDFTVAKQKITVNNELAIKQAKTYDHRQGSIFLHGPRGAGKSHMAAILKRPLVTGGFKVRTINMPLIIDEILSGIKSGTYGALTKQWLDLLSVQPILSIEDMGVEKPSDHALGFYYKFINARYEAKRTGMIITCNYSMIELENRWAAADPQGRVVSRLKEMCRGSIISFAGCPDWRANP